MSRTLIQDVVTLTKAGWRPYNASPEKSVYAKLGCDFVVRGRNPRKPVWFVRDDVFCCIGCGSRCSLTRPEGFPAPLPIRYSSVPHDLPYTLTPQEMVQKLDILNVRQAAYCLNVSERTIYDMIAEGKLIRLKDNPVRVRVKEIRELRGDFDE